MFGPSCEVSEVVELLILITIQFDVWCDVFIMTLDDTHDDTCQAGLTDIGSTS